MLRTEDWRTETPHGGTWWCVNTKSIWKKFRFWRVLCAETFQAERGEKLSHSSLNIN